METASGWARLVGGLAIVFAIFHWSAITLGSDRGQAGIIVALLVAAATFTVERVAFGTSLATAARSLGFGRPAFAGIAASATVCILLLSIPAILHFTGTPVRLLSGWPSLVPGLFAQAGIAEELLFRGYLFRRLRRTRSFWRAAWLAMVPFVIVHLILFFTMPWPVALAALLLSVVSSFPFAHLFEIGGHTIWAPALLHFVIQGTVKIVEVPAEAASWFPPLWMGASAALPMLTFLIRRQTARP